MRLLNTETLALQEFMDNDIPDYAILSHRWQDGEVSFQDVQSETAERKAGYAKIKACCELALERGIA